MIYLFWAFAVVWIGLFAYMRALMRRTSALEQEMRRLAGGTSDASRTGQRTEDRSTPVSRDVPSPVSRATP